MDNILRRHMILKIIGKLLMLFIVISICLSCVSIKKENLRIIIFSENQKEFLEDIALYKNYNIKMTKKGYYWIIENLDEDILLEIISIARLKMDLIADNMANINTTRTANGEPFKRNILKLSPENGIEILKDTMSEHNLRWEPSHPDAVISGDRKGYVLLPNIDIMAENMDLIATSRLYDVISEYLREKYKIIIIN